MPVSRCPRILTASLLCIAGLLIVPLLINFISSDLFTILQSHLSLRVRLLIFTMIVSLCLVPLVIEVNYHKEKDKNKNLLPQTNCCSEPKVHGRATGLKVRRRPRRRNADADNIRDFLSSLLDEGLRIQSPVHGALTVHTEQQVPDVEAALQYDHTKCGSKIVHKAYEWGPQSGHDTLDTYSSHIEEALRYARELDQNCTFQFGSFALFKYKDGELKCWRLQEDWTPKISDIYRSAWNIVDFFTGQGPTWIIRGSNLQNATLRASTSNEKENIIILHCHKMEAGEDVLLCAEPGLIRRSILKFWKGVHICALKSVKDTKKGLDFELQSESKDAKIPYCFSVVKGFIPSPRTMMITMAYLLLLGTLGCVTHGGTYGGMCFRLSSYDVGLQKITTIFGATSEILTVSASTLHVLFFIIVFPILAYWCCTAKQVPPFDDNLSVTIESPPAIVEYELSGKREIVGEPGDDVPGPPRTIPLESSSKTSCPRSPLLNEEIMNIEEKEEGDSMPSLQMCVPFEDLINPGNATSLLPEEDESMNSNLNKDEKHKEEDDNIPSPQIGVPFEGGDVPNPQTTSSRKMWSSSRSYSIDLRYLVLNLRSKKKVWGDGRRLDTDGPEFQELVKDFKNVSDVKELNLVGEDLGDAIISALGKAMLEVPFICLTSLELGGNSLTDDGVRNIAKAIKKGHLPALESLGLFPFRRGNNRPRFIQREEAQWIRNLIKDEGVKILATAFASGHTSSLKVLTLEQNGINTEGANFLAHEIRRGHLPALEVLNLSYNDVGDEGIEALAVAFAEKGNNLKVLDLETCNISAEGTKALATAFMSGQFSELTELYLGTNHTSRRGSRDGPPSDEGLIELARVLQNGELPKLQTVDLEHLADNTSRRVAKAFRKAVHSNLSLVLTLKISWPLYSQYEGSVRRALERNRRVATMLQHLNGEEDVAATNGKIFLCGQPQQGKTTLRKSLQMDADALRTHFIQEKSSRYEPRTRGIEVSHIVSKGINLAIWDVAGQSEYNVLHSAFLPDLAFAESQATTFVIVCDANYLGRHHGEQLLNYWMRFIASSSIKGDENGKRRVILVLNRFNEKPCVSEGLWKLSLAEARKTFHDYLEIEKLPFVIDARVATSVKPLKEHLIQHTREILNLETKRVPKICQFIQDTITEVVKTRDFPVVPWAGFSAMFQSMVSEEQKLKAAAEYLHESGHLIIFREGFEGSTHHKEGSTSEGAGPGRSLVVLDPDWFCRKVVGHLLLPDREAMLVDGESPLTRWVRPDGSLALRDVKDYFRHLLLDEQQVSDIVAMLLRLGICYHVGTDRVLIPALILENNQNQSGSSGKSGMQMVRDQWVMGYCLKVQHKTTTLLPIAVFQRLQVELAKDPMCAAADSEYAAGKYNITFLTDGMAVLVELSAHEQDPNLEDRVDILVRPLVSREQDRFAEKRKELQVHVAQFIQEKFISLAEIWSPGVEFIRLVVKPWSTGEGIIVMEERNVTLSVEEVKSRVQTSGPQANTAWIVDGEQVMAIDLLSGGELRELETSVAENCDLNG